jgi:hypothetical protein
MEGFVAHKLNEFETGKISRRRLIETLTLAATTAYAADSANAASPRDAALINHISYTCPDFKKAADWYSMVFNLDQVGTTAHDTALPFGKKGDQPYNVTAKDVPLPHIIVRSRDPHGPPAPSVRRPRAAVIDHIGYTAADFNCEGEGPTDRIGAANARWRLEQLHMDDVMGYDVQISGPKQCAD